MREVYFRVWDNKLHVMWQPISFDKLLRYLVFQTMPNSDAYCAMKDHLRDMVWEQYVYTTKKGTDIYVGDKFDVDEADGLIGFMAYDVKNMRFALALHEIQEDGSLQFLEYEDCFTWEDMEPIGNIHENPELLESTDGNK